MDATELKALQESVKAANATNAILLERAIKGDAREAAAKILAGLSLHEAAKTLVVDNVLRDTVPQKDGVLDLAKFTETVTAEAKRIGAAFSQASGGATVHGMGSGTPIAAVEAPKPEDVKAHAVKTFQRLGMSEAAAKRAAEGRAA